jgi:hypothetical protein
VGHPSDPRFLVLHGLRLKGFAEPEGVAAAVGLETAQVEAIVPELLEQGLVLRRDGRLSGWSLTREGRGEQQALAAKELADLGVEPEVRSGYERFLTLNGGLLALCTDWQVRGAGINDHTDAAYDAAVIDRLVAVEAGVQPILADLTATLDRFAAYGPRLAGSVERVRAGELDYFTKPIIDSFHTVWFELHEDLLTSLGLERSQEGA